MQGYIKTLRTALQGKNDAALKADENRIRALALKTTSNINALIKDLFYNPPAYKASITLSFKSSTGVAAKAANEPSAGAVKRPGFTPVTFGGDEPTSKKAAKDDKKVYAPPGGKFSAKVAQFPADEGGAAGRGEGGRRGGARGGGRGGRGYRY